VVAIIALLAAILLPALNKAKNQAKTTSCASNLKQIGYAVICYADDYNGTFPSFEYAKALPFTYDATTTIAGNNGKSPLIYLVYDKYISGCTRQNTSHAAAYKAVTVCQVTFDAYKSTLFVNAPWRYGGSYSYNLHLNKTVDLDGTHTRMQRLDKVLRPSSRFMFTDSAVAHAVGLVTKLSWMHGKVDNFLYLDGHTETLPMNGFPVTISEYGNECAYGADTKDAPPW
jgi:prepilin-type processing-associated H-X9-DG protein